MLSFLMASLAILIVPGPDLALMTRNVSANGRTGGFFTLAGFGLGFTVHAALAVGGVTALLAASPSLFETLKIVGALYLLHLAAGSVRRAMTAGAGEVEVAGARSSRRRCLREGALSNALNPKVGLFFVAFLPQFIDPGRSAALSAAALAGMYLALAVAYYVMFIVAISKLSALLARPRVARAVEVVSAAALAGLAVATVLH